MRYGAQERAPDQEPLGEQFVLQNADVVWPAARRRPKFGRSEMEQLPGKVPLVNRLIDVNAFVTLESNQLPAGPSGQGVRHLGLTAAGLAFEEEWTVEHHGQEDRGGQTVVGEVPMAFESTPNLVGRLGKHKRSGAGLPGSLAHHAWTLMKTPSGAGAVDGACVARRETPR